uniref:Pickpocket 29, isoform E n=1 Tax=Drosophila melanogaster TaxID=7227 RepID=A8DYP2_DROME|nr:pickpocket 29, isoform F [Drosophila melanogaster]NP_001137748.1 pickpocket 29, isoform E [Drosophila melanogaster]ABV53901.1 pickpocket 29, isoform F [Drosophila melanogaster]ACL83201.1 pickpocket 29, isoform E [Drosophila melanogaster]|eukprot:NP_001097441.1 pickpocket 29, isoform F [Drosophila melanogaster]
MWRKSVMNFRGFIRSFVENKGLLWIFVIGISGWSTVSILVLLKTRYETDSTTIGVSTAYSRWINTFPSIGICLTKSRAFNEFKAMMREYFQEDFAFSFTRMIYEYAFLNPNNIFTKEPTKNTSYPYNFNILDIRRKMFPTNCTECFKEIYFRGELVTDCEEIFKFHVTEMGYCFLANNLLDYDSIEEMPLRYSSLDNNRSLRLYMRSSVMYKYEMYVNSPEDLPFFNSLTYTISTDPTTYAFNVEEIHNHEGVIDEPISQRKCKFPSESSIEGFPYSFSACMSIIRSEFEMKTCDCSLFNPKDRST